MPTFLLKQIGIMEMRRLLIGTALTLTISFSVAQEISIEENKYVRIGDIEQWITIKGENRSNPVLLLLHGGPGSPSSPFSEAIFGDWEKDFILVNWDQRGAGRTFGRNTPEKVDEDYWIENPLTIEQMTADGIEVSEYLRKHLGKEKIILLGTSWGSVLGVKMAQLRPDLYYAYIGHSQLVNPSADIVQVYHNTAEFAQQNSDSTSLELLKSLGSPPYHNAKHMGQLLRIVKQYELKNSIPAPDSWSEIAREYDRETDASYRYDGDDYSFIHYVGHKPLGIEGMISTINLMEDGREFEIPVYLIQGEKDILTPLSLTAKYFEEIKAPEKELIVIPGAAHGFNQSVRDVAYRLLSQKIRPSTKAPG